MDGAVPDLNRKGEIMMINSIELVKARRIASCYRAAQKLVNAEKSGVTAANIDELTRLLNYYVATENAAFSSGVSSAELPILSELKAA